MLRVNEYTIEQVECICYFWGSCMQPALKY